MLFVSRICLCIILSCLFLAALRSPAGKGLSPGSLACDVFSCVIVTFPYGVPESGVVFDCIDF